MGDAKAHVSRSGIQVGGAQSSSIEVLQADDFAKPCIVTQEFLDELVQPPLENVVHLAVFEPVTDTAGVALRRPLAAVGDADLIEVANQIAVATRQRARQRVIQNEQIGDQPRL
jgi:hypothetical protein